MSDERRGPYEETVARRLARIEPTPGLRVEVFVTKRRYCFGRFDLRCEPARGEGAAWVRADNVEFLEPEQEQRGGDHE